MLEGGPMRKLLVAALGVCFCACSATGPAVQPQVDGAPRIEKVDRGATHVEGELGGMNEEAVASKFESLKDPIFACVTDGAARVKELGGHFAISLRIDREGGVKTAYLAESTLGDRATERCVLDVVRKATWPKPLGGEGIAKRSFDVDAGVEPFAAKADRIKPAIAKLAQKINACKSGGRGHFVATAYVKPNGKVKSAGVAPPNADAEQASDCVVEAIQSLRLGPIAVGRRAAKVTFEI